MIIKINKKKLEKFLPLKYKWNNSEYLWMETPVELEEQLLFKKVNSNQQKLPIKIDLGDERGMDKIIFDNNDNLLELLYVFGNKELTDIYLDTESNINFLENLFGKNLITDFEEKEKDRIIINFNNININSMDWSDKKLIYQRINDLGTTQSYEKIKEITDKVDQDLWLDEDFISNLATKNINVLKGIDRKNSCLVEKEFWKILNKNNLTHHFINSSIDLDRVLNAEEGISIIDYYVKSGQFKKDFLNDNLKTESILFQILGTYPKMIKNKEVLKHLVFKIINYDFTEVPNLEIMKHYQLKDFDSKEQFIDFYIEVLPLIGKSFYGNHVEHLTDLFPQSIKDDGYLIKKFLESNNINRASYESQTNLVNNIFSNIKSAKEIFDFYIKELPEIMESNRVPYILSNYNPTEKKQFDELYEKKLYKLLFNKNVDYYYNLEEVEVEKIVPVFNQFLNDSDIPKKWIENINIIKYRPTVIISCALHGKAKREIKNLLKNEDNCINLLEREIGIFNLIEPKNITENIALTYFDKINLDFRNKTINFHKNTVRDTINEFKLVKIPKEFFLKIDFCIKLISKDPKYLMFCHPLVLNSDEMKKHFIDNNLDCLTLNIDINNIPKDIIELTKVSKEHSLTMKDMYEKVKIYEDVINSNNNNAMPAKKNKI